MRESRLDPSASPLKAFGAQLRRLRKAAGLTQTRLGELTNLSDSQISNLERGTRSPTLDWVRSADRALDAGGSLELTYWSLSGSSLLEGFSEYAQQEAKAQGISHFELGIVPGLAQTMEYAEAFVAAAVRRGSITEEKAAGRLDFLAARQKLLDRRPAPRLHFVLDEGALLRTVGGAKVMARQLAHLEDLASRPNITIQVAPFSLAEELPFTMVVTLLTLADRTLLAYSECQLRGFLARDTETARAWERDYHQLQVEALSKAASLEMIRKQGVRGTS
ncbi:helix-turn-helix domain-containing protein [Streptomyces sp. 1331.2]|uniref:helix-turn-helix domain-containing protein n=1 Tax=Streptomyces sp. 1331.2 TaxID=1938835 RepID=UPI000BD62FB5|nr:helix-turn-helix transcriptional regulator [Streptomyces sp. 1331.2]SOB78686.1 Helix-turn-helix domain-containing protein [Streptomyces sp. 1331.2]